MVLPDLLEERGRVWNVPELVKDAVAMDLKSLERTWNRHCKDEFDPGVWDLESFTIHKSDVGQAPGLSRQQSVFMTLQHAATLLLYASPVRRSALSFTSLVESSI